MVSEKPEKQEPINPFIYCQTPIFTTAVLPTSEDKRKEPTVINFNPCKDFRLKIIKDNDWNLDIYLHVNPKNIVTGIPKALGIIRKMKK